MSGVNVFGWEAPEFIMPLYRDSDFTFNLEANPAWPSGIEAEFRFSTTYPNEDENPIVWQASLDDTTLSWDILAAQVNEVIDANAKFIKLKYSSESGRTRLWMKGTVRVG
jgi:hypothetical protein